MEKILLPLKAKHFKDADFDNPCNCGISIAGREHFNIERVSEGLGVLITYDNGKKTKYTHEYYGGADFDFDHAIAAANSFDETIIRTIELIPQ